MKNLKAIKKISVTFFITIFLINILCINLSAENIKYKKGGILYKYDAATASKDWTVFNRGKWTFGTDGISVENNDNRTGNDAWYYTYFGAKNGWKNYVIECDMENVSECAILFRITIGNCFKFRNCNVFNFSAIISHISPETHTYTTGSIG